MWLRRWPGLALLSVVVGCAPSSGPTSSDGGRAVDLTSSIPDASPGVIRALSGRGHYGCAVLATGAAKCWGANDQGQLGNGTFAESSTAVPVLGLDSGVEAVSVGTEHACAIASGRVFCWGAGNRGRLGPGSSSARSARPVEVTGLTNVRAVSAGAVHTCVITSERRVRCWGAGDHFELGDGSGTDSAVPVTVASMDDATALSAGNDATCVVRASGQIWCWGWPYNQEDAWPRPRPFDAAASKGWKAVSRSALSPVWCRVGENKEAECRWYNFTSRFTDVAQLSAGNYWVCVALSDGELRCQFDQHLGPSAVTVPPLGKVLRLADHGDCGALRSGAVVCWNDLTETFAANEIAGL